ncbi:MAG: serine/threonine protein kinase, partial [Spirochaetia bacterium]
MFSEGDIIHKSYTVITVLGSGRMADTYLAKNSAGGLVIIKALDLSKMQSWKNLELFEREAEILQNLKHNRLPQYTEHFKESSGTGETYFLIYEYIEGKSISQLMQQGKRFSFDEIRQILIQILEILSYLHSLHPPVIHRDINPNNIILTAEGNTFLVDFGAGKHVFEKSESDDLEPTTFIGTYGYMPMEQIAGDAVPASDIYALGMTAIKLITGKTPNKLPHPPDRRTKTAAQLRVL